jgi:hypothetical protein
MLCSRLFLVTDFPKHHMTTIECVATVWHTPFIEMKLTTLERGNWVAWSKYRISPSLSRTVMSAQLFVVPLGDPNRLGICRFHAGKMCMPAWYSHPRIDYEILRLSIWFGYHLSKFRMKFSRGRSSCLMSNMLLSLRRKKSTLFML